MKLMTLLRTQQGRSKAEVARAANIPTTFLTWAEQDPTRYLPYPGQLDRLKAALFWDGSAEDLMKEVTGDAASD